MYREIMFDNNLTIVYERLDYLRSVSIGVWIGTGSRYETQEQNGISHFIEHMLFKGTGKRSARDIACEIDGIGGQINAFTGKDCTCIYTTTLDTDLETAVDVLSDMLFNSVFDPDQIETEKNIILEEISMYEDDPEELVNDILNEEIWCEGPLGYPILGTEKSLKKLSRENIIQYMADYYNPDNCVISVVGNFHEDKLLDILQKYFGAWKPLNYCRLSLERPVFKSGFLFRKKEIEQTHICMGFKGVPMDDGRLYSLWVLNNIIAGGISSRLFQDIREESGLVYNIYSFITSFRDCGMFTIYAAAKADRAGLVIESVRNEICNLLTGGINDGELRRSRDQLKGNFILGLDSTLGRMSSLGKSKITTGIVRSPEYVLKRIDGVNTDSVMEMADLLFSRGNIGITVLGETPVPNSVLDGFKFDYDA